MSPANDRHGKLLIFGASGFTGSHLAAAALRQGWQVTAAGRTPVDWIDGLRNAAADLTDPASVEALFEAVQPDAVINAAAMAVIDQVEQERDLAWRVNVEGSETIAACAARWNARCVYISSDSVFDGCAQAYTEESPVNPLNFYGKTKAESEKRVLAACPEAVIVRTSLILGLPLHSGNAFLALLQQKLASGEGAFAPAEEVRTPIDIYSLCDVLLELVERPIASLLHVGATESIDRLALTRRLARELGYSPEAVRAMPSQPDTHRAPRHRNGVILVEKAARLLHTPLPTLEEVIQRSLHGKSTHA